MFVPAPAVDLGGKQVWTTMLEGQKMSRHLQGVPEELAKVMDWLQVSATPLQSMPVQVAVMVGQLVTMLVSETVTPLVQQVLVQVGVGKVQLVALQRTTWLGGHTSVKRLVVTP